MGKFLLLVMLVLGGVFLYTAWPEIKHRTRPRQESNEGGEVMENLRKMQGVYTGRQDPYYHCRARCPDRTGGTSSPVALEKARGSGYEACPRCCGD
jgi:hypothetical protein